MNKEDFLRNIRDFQRRGYWLVGVMFAWMIAVTVAAALWGDGLREYLVARYGVETAQMLLLGLVIVWGLPVIPFVVHILRAGQYPGAKCPGCGILMTIRQRWLDHVATKGDCPRCGQQILERDEEGQRAKERQETEARNGDRESAGLNRLGIGNERVLQGRLSQSLWPRTVRWRW